MSKKPATLLRGLPRRALTDAEISSFARRAKIKHYRGTFMLDELKYPPRRYESGVVNLQPSVLPGSHWVGYVKNGGNVRYYDSFGLRPPPEIVRYFRDCSALEYSFDREQNFDTYVCGHLTLRWLIKETGAPPAVCRGRSRSRARRRN